MSSWDAWDECEVWISLFLGLGKNWTSLGLKWEKKIARCDFWFWSAATSATALGRGRCSASPCLVRVVLLVALQRYLLSAVALHCSQRGFLGFCEGILT